MKVALIKPQATYADWYRYPAINLTYISTYLENNGFECKIFDAYFNSWSEKELFEKIKEYKPSIAGISAMTHEIISASQIAAKIKKQLAIPIMIGGCHITALPKQTLDEFPVFDYGIFGEGERTILELLKCIESKRQVNFGFIKGLVFRNNGKVIVNESRPFLTPEELDSLPFPDLHNYYKNDSRALSGRNTCYLIFSSRGCPYNCAFCMRVLGNKVRRRSVQNICEEIEYAINRYGAHIFDFSDEVFLFDCQETRILLKSMVERGFPKRIRWSANTRVNQVNPDIIALAKRAGCFRLGMGIESGDDGILRAIGKNITTDQVKQAVKIIKDEGISLGTYFILGHPNETRQTLTKTIDLISKLNTKTVAVGIMVPYPGTEIYNMALRSEGGYRLISQNWSDYDKYGKISLEIKDLPYQELLKWQRRAIINLYFKNFRLFDFLNYLWSRKKGIYFITKQMIASFLKKFSLSNNVY